MLLGVLIFLVISCLARTSYGACIQLDRDSLVSFNLSISISEHPLNWSLSHDCCSWEGIDCDESGRVTNVSLPSRGLSGTLPPPVLKLTSLRILSLSDNKLRGPIPRDIGKLSELEHLQLHNNQLNGSIPLSLTNCTKLIKLDLGVNSLDGQLSNFDFSNFTQLRSINLGNNHFQGGLPATLFSCKKLTEIHMGSNNITGQILPEIAGLQSLSFLSLSNNNLSNITDALDILKRCGNLRQLILSNNFYDEPLPDHDILIDSDAKLQYSLETLSLGGCRFTGQIPAWLRRMQKIGVLDLSHNSITGPIPGWMGNLTNLYYLDLSYNFLSGSFPKEISGLPRLGSVTSASRLDSTQICSAVNCILPSPFTSPINVTIDRIFPATVIPRAIYCGNNSISGTIPVKIGRLESIIVLDLKNNNFSGNIPDGISNLNKLEKLDLSGNHLTGEIPASFRKLNFLSWFSVAYNDLEGPIPTGGQFDTFSSSNFEGNPGLCGAVLNRSCHRSPKERRVETQEQGDGRRGGVFNWVSFAIGFAFSFIGAAIIAFKFLNCCEPKIQTSPR